MVAKLFVVSQHVGFVVVCLLLAVPRCIAMGSSSGDVTLHSINAGTAFYTMAVGSLVKSCAKVIDCTSHQGGLAPPTLDALPDMTCWEGSHWALASLGLVGLLVYCVVVPVKLFSNLRASAADGEFSDDELQKGGWLILKVCHEQFHAVYDLAA